MFKTPAAKLDVEQVKEKNRLVNACLFLAFCVNGYTGLTYIFFGYSIAVARFTPPSWAFDGRGMLSLLLAAFTYVLYKQKSWAYYIYIILVLINSFLWYLCTYKNMQLSLAYLFVNLFLVFVSYAGIVFNRRHS